MVAKRRYGKMAQLKPGKDYLYLLDHFTAQVMQDRYDSMEKRAIAFIKAEKLENDVIVNHECLNVVMLDYFADIARLKDFELIKRTNKNKITAFMAYWWLRRRPLQIITDRRDNEELVYINEKFVAAFLSKDFLFKNAKYLMENPKCEQYLKHIYYHLKYRVYTAQTLELFLMAIDVGQEIGRLNASLSEDE